MPCFVASSTPDLIRHGKTAKEANVAASAQPQQQPQHHTSGGASAYPPAPQPVPPAASTASAHPHAPSSSQRQNQDAPRTKPLSKMEDPAFQRQIEELVRQERTNKEKMPSYDGLEGFALVEKMGE